MQENEQRGEWFWSENEESWLAENGPWPTRFAAERAGIAEMPQDDPDVKGFWTGRRVRVKWSDIITTGLVNSMLEGADERLNELCGESSEGVISDISGKAIDDLTPILAEVVGAVIARHGYKITCWSVEDVQWHSLEGDEA